LPKTDYCKELVGKGFCLQPGDRNILLFSSVAACRGEFERIVVEEVTDQTAICIDKATKPRRVPLHKGCNTTLIDLVTAKRIVEKYWHQQEMAAYLKYQAMQTSKANSRERAIIETRQAEQFAEINVPV